MFNVCTPGWPFLVGGEVDCEWEPKGKRCILFDVNSELKLSQMSRPCKLISGTAEFNRKWIRGTGWRGYSRLDHDSNESMKPTQKLNSHVSSWRP